MFKKCNFAAILLLTLLATASFAQLPAKPSAPSDFPRILAEFQNADGKTVLVAAHRCLTGLSTGQWSKSPENSLSAIERSIAIGVDIVEIDVRKTKDGHLVLMHDGTVDRTTDGRGKVSDMTLAQIKNLRLRTGTTYGAKQPGPVSEERVPTLEEAMLLCKGKCMVNLDKAGGIVPECCEVLKKTGTFSQAIFTYSYSPAECKKLSTAYTPSPFLKPTFLNGRDWNRAKRKGWEILSPYVEAARPAVFELVFQDDNDPLIAASTTDRARKGGARVWTNSMWGGLCAGHTDAVSLKDPKAGWGWMVARGANIVQTDEAEKLLEYLRSQGLHW